MQIEMEMYTDVFKGRGRLCAYVNENSFSLVHTHDILNERHQAKKCLTFSSTSLKFPSIFHQDLIKLSSHLCKALSVVVSLFAKNEPALSANFDRKLLFYHC